MTGEEGVLHRFLRCPPIRWKIFAFLAVFVAALLLILYLLQVVFLDEIYRAITIQSVKDASLTLAGHIDDQDLDSLVEQIAWRDQLCVRILDESGQDLYSASTLHNCVIHSLSPQILHQQWQWTRREGGVLEFFETTDSPAPPERMEEDFLRRFPPSPVQQLIQTRLVQREDGSQVLVLVNGVVTPINATVSTLRVQFIWIAVFLLAASLGMALLLSRLISRPIAAISQRAKELARGNYGLTFPSGGCREIDDLSDTLTYAAGELSKTENLRQELIANVSHDLRTPLTMIAGYGEMMRDIPGENNRENAQVIVDEASRLTQLVNDMLDLSKLRSGTISLDREVVSLTQTVRDIVLRWNKLVEPQRCRLTFQAEEELSVLADGLKLSQVIYNLIGNAIVHSGSQGEVTVRQLRRGDQVLLQVADNGPGIPPQQLPLIWERYHTSRQTPGEVGGLGLAIVKAVLDLHGAQYGVESVVGQGSTFWFQLPLA